MADSEFEIEQPPWASAEPEPGAPASDESGPEAKADPTVVEAERPRRRKKRRRRKRRPEPRYIEMSEDDREWLVGDVSRRVQAGDDPEYLARVLGDDGYSPADVAEALEAAAVQQSHGDDEKQILHGVFWIVGGLLITGVSYATAGEGGSYIVTSGAVVYGLFKVISRLD